ncbi:MAG TPA: hypothetical protein PLD25_31035 [Chloroflexota bacterium]|nr:hypothetical protein [Chloroflexota bacterium]HUM70462.1 hypothetical protein [Chloroflexota bacterium]
MDNDERVQIIGPMADHQQLPGNLDSAIVGAGVGQRRRCSAAPDFYLQIPVRIGHGMFSLPADRYS